MFIGGILDFKFDKCLYGLIIVGVGIFLYEIGMLLYLIIDGKCICLLFCIEDIMKLKVCFLEIMVELLYDDNVYEIFCFLILNLLKNDDFVSVLLFWLLRIIYVFFFKFLWLIGKMFIKIIFV